MGFQGSLSDDMLAVLRRYWGYGSFRPLQQEIITSVLSGHDTLGLLPTGGGKSLTFQVPAMMLDGVTLVVTPLISLMKDQVDNLRSVGIPATYLYSGMNLREHNLALDRCHAGKARLLYVSPEKLRSATFVSSLSSLPVSMIVVDEAHCISQWGYDFRPSYLAIADVRRLFPHAPVLALTASATPQVAEDIMERLAFKERRIYARSFHRDNLSYIVRYDVHKEEALLRVLRGVEGTAIVYVRSRRRTVEIARMLTEKGISADYYHAGLDPADKADKQNRWKDGSLRVIVATNAFGMGIDKPDVRVVVHYDLPPSLEEYYQEAGRAGRDGKHAFAVLLAAPYDKATLSRRISDAFPPKDYIRKVYELACNFVSVPVGEGVGHTYEFDFNRFVATYRLNATMAHSALGLLTRAGYVEYSDDISGRGRVMMLTDKQRLYDLDFSGDADRVLQCLLRSYSGLFADYVSISESMIASRCQMTEKAVYEALLELTRLHALHYIPRRTLPYLYLPIRRVLPKHVDMPLNVYEQRKQVMEHRIAAMRRFAFDTDRCRVTGMLEYFGEKPETDCGRCDVCRSRRSASSTTTVNVAESVMYLAGQPGGHTIDYMVAQLGPSYRDAVIETVRELLDREAVTMATDGSIISVKP